MDRSLTSVQLKLEAQGKKSQCLWQGTLKRDDELLAGGILGGGEGGGGLRGFWGANGPGYMGLLATTRVPMGAKVPVPVLSPNDHPNASWGRQKGFGKNGIFENFQVPRNNVKQQQFRGFQGTHGPGYMGLAATTWVPMGAHARVLPPNDHPNPSQGRQKGLGKSRMFENFQPMQASLKMAKSSTAMACMRGGIRSLDPRPPLLVRGPSTRKRLFRIWIQIHTWQLQYTKKF